MISCNKSNLFRIAPRRRLHRHTCLNMARTPSDRALERGNTKHNFVLSLPEDSSADTSRLPLVVLAGWVGCQDRHLSKFSLFLNKAGYPTIRSVCPTSAIFFPTAHLRQRWTEALLDYIHAVDPHRPLVLWAFSNGGAFPIRIISRLVEGDDRYKCFQQRILGVIFDSAPCYLHGSTGARALGEGQPAVLRAVLSALFYLIMLVMAVTDPTAPQNFWSEMASLRLGRKCLYLYSADDHLCDAAKLEELIALRRAQGHAVRSHKWEASRHVAHYRFHPKQYVQLVTLFLKELQGS